MKKIFLSLLFILIIGYLLSGKVFAQDASSSSSMGQLMQTSVEYELPYPGILPDNFLYPLKAFRDRLVSFFISDSQKKAEFDLLQADKRLVAGEMMLQEGKKRDMLISETISKGENYFEESIQSSSKAKEEGRLVNDFLDKLTKAGIKHEQILYEMSLQTQGQLKQNLLDDVARVQNFENEVNKLKQQK